MLEIKRILALISKTNDKCIVHDDALGDFAVLTLTEYERLLALPPAPAQKQPKKASKTERKADDDGEAMEFPEDMEDADEFDEELAEKNTDDHYYFEPVDDEK